MDAYRVAFNTWQEKTEWVQKDKRFDVLLPWGKHRADVLKEYIDHLEAKCAALLDELEAKDAKIANLTSERDALREGETGDSKHSNTRAAADIYFQLVEECEIPAGGSLVEYVSELRERAAAGKGE